jgi:type I restriction enzyme M protein
MFENAFNNIDRTLRNDERLASARDHAEQTSWLLFLKYLDDFEAAPKRDDGEFDHQIAMTGQDLTVTLSCWPTRPSAVASARR